MKLWSDVALTYSTRYIILRAAWVLKIFENIDTAKSPLVKDQ